MKIAITGANGHVGGNLVRMLLSENMDLRVLQHHQHQAIDGLDVEVVNGDLNDPGSLETFCKDIDVVIHLAAKISIGHNSFERLFKINVDGTKNLVRAAKAAGVRRFIHFSSIHALQYSPIDEIIDESKTLATGSAIAYEHTKALADEWILTQQADDFDVIVLNPTSIIGPNDFQPSLQGSFLIRLYNGTLPGLVPGGYDWVDVRDVCKAARSAISHGKAGERYILSGNFVTVVELAGLVARITGKKLKKPVLPLWLAYVGVPFIYLWSKLRGQEPLYTKQSLFILQSGNRKISNLKARKELNYHPRPLEETLRDTLNWLKENNFIKA